MTMAVPTTTLQGDWVRAINQVVQANTTTPQS